MEQISIFTEQNGIFTGQNETLEGQNETLTGQNETLTGQNETLTGQNETLTGQNETLTGQNETLTGQNEILAGQNNIFDEKKQMTDLVKVLKDLFRFANPFKDIRPDKIDALERLEKAIKGIPPSDVFIRAIEENISTAKKFIDQAKSIRAESFKRHEAEYIKSLNSESKTVREYNDGWRVGKLMVKVRPGLSKIKILYNEQVLINWTPVNSKEDFIDLETRANDLLTGQVIPEQDITDIFSEAFKQAKNHLPGKANSSLVPIHDFYKEVRIALIRKLLENKGSAAKIDKYHKFPLWAFLYNLDIYRSLGSKVPDNKKLGLQTGSQQETSQNKGLVVNGLNPNDEYKVMCYVIAIQRGSGR